MEDEPEELDFTVELWTHAARASTSRAARIRRRLRRSPRVDLSAAEDAHHRGKSCTEVSSCAVDASRIPNKQPRRPKGVQSSGAILVFSPQTALH